MTQRDSTARVLPPDVDDIAVLRATWGDLDVPLNEAEAEAAIDILAAPSRDLSHEQIAEKLGTTKRTVTRWLAGQSRPFGRHNRRWLTMPPARVT